MDLSLWDAPVVQVADDRHFCNWNDWYCDFHFGFGQDVIEENALNETSCMQVLKILISKTDDEIMQLEDNISVLENSLDLANTELSKLCSVVRERSDCLEKPIQFCKDVHDEHDPGLQLQSHTEPANRVHDPCKDMQQKSDQCGSATASIPSILAGIAGNKKDVSKKAEAVEGEKRIEDFNFLDKGVKQNPHDMPQQNMRKFTELASAPMRSLFLAEDEVGSPKVARRVNDHETEETKKVSGSPYNDEMEDPSANPQQKMEGILESNCCNSSRSSIENVQNSCNSSRSSIENVQNCCNSSRSSIENILVDSSAMVSVDDLETSDDKYDIKLEMKGLSSTAIKGGAKVNCAKTYESKCLIRASIKDVNEYPVDKEAASNVLCVTEVREQSVVSMPSSDAKVVGSAPRSKTDTPVCFVENSCRMQDNEKIIETSRQKKGSQKKPALSQQKKMEIDSLQQIKGKHKRSTEMEPISVDSLIELINGRNNAKRPQKKVKGKLQASHIKEPEAFVANGSIKKEYTKLERKHHVNPETVDPSLAEESGFNVASLEMVKRRKSETAALLEFNNTNIKREEESDLVGTKLADGCLTSIITTTHTPSNNESTILPLSYENEDFGDLHIECAKVHDIVMKVKLEESAETPSCSSTSDSRVQTVEERLSVSDLHLMTLPKLKDIARRYHLKGYNKLTKAKLVGFIAEELELGSSHQ